MQRFSVRRQDPGMFGRLLLPFMLVVLCAGVTGASGRGAPGWRLVDLRLGSHSVATGVNGAGQVVGTFTRGGTSHVFLWHDGRMRDLGPGRAVGVNGRGQVAINGDHRVRLWQDGRSTDIGSFSRYGTVALDLSSGGEIVGWSGTRAQRMHAVVWRNGRLIDLGRHGLASSQAVAINDAGAVLGWRHPSKQPWEISTRYRALVWQHGREQDLGVSSGPDGYVLPVAIAAGGEAIGSTETRAGRPRGFFWARGTLTDLGSFIPSALNDRLQLVGSSSGADGTVHAFAWQHGKLTELGRPPDAGDTTASMISPTGLIVGVSVPRDAQVRRVVAWQNGHLVVLPSPSNTDSEARAVNEHGLIVGSSGGRAVIWSP